MMCTSFVLCVQKEKMNLYNNFCHNGISLFLVLFLILSINKVLLTTCSVYIYVDIHEKIWRVANRYQKYASKTCECCSLINVGIWENFVYSNNSHPACHSADSLNLETHFLDRLSLGSVCVYRLNFYIDLKSNTSSEMLTRKFSNRQSIRQSLKPGFQYFGTLITFYQPNTVFFCFLHLKGLSIEIY